MVLTLLTKDEILDKWQIEDYTDIGIMIDDVYNIRYDLGLFDTEEEANTKAKELCLDFYRARQLKSYMEDIDNDMAEKYGYTIGDSQAVKEERSKEAHIRSNSKYIKKAYKTVIFRISRIYEQDMVDYIESIENKQKYIKDLIREDMKKNKS